MDDHDETASRDREPGSPGYPTDTPGYPDSASTDPLPREFDAERFLSPREALKLIPPDQPVAHDGKAGWGVERATGRAIWISGAPQYDVLNRMPGVLRDEPGLTDFPAHGGLPAPAPADGELRSEADRERRKRVQIGLKLSFDQAEDLEAAAELFGVTRTTMARLLVVRGAREILERSTESAA